MIQNILNIISDFFCMSSFKSVFAVLIQVIKIIPFIFLSYNNYIPSKNFYKIQTYFIYFLINFCVFCISLYFNDFIIFKILNTLSIVIYYQMYCSLFGSFPISFLLILFLLILFFFSDQQFFSSNIPFGIGEIIV